MWGSRKAWRTRSRSAAAALAAASLLSIGAASVARAADPLPATELAQDVTLSEGAQAGVVHLKSKGGFGGDVVAVDVDGARIPNKAVTARVRIEFWGADAAGQTWTQDRANGIAAAINARLSGLTGSDGTPVTVDVIPKARAAGAPPTPGFHQIELRDVPKDSMAMMVHGDPTGPSGVRTGEWSSNEDVTKWAHETVHLLGFHDRYLGLQPDLLVDGRRYPLPQFTGDKADTAALDAWFAQVLNAETQLEMQLHKTGALVPGVPPGHENDILATTDNPNSTVLKSDLDDIIARAGVHVIARSGDTVANKSGDQQNLGVGAALDLFAPRGGSAHADGLVAYCVDFHRGIPSSGVGFDVLGPAKDLGSPQLVALQRVLEEIGRRQATLPLNSAAHGGTPPGAQDAVWAVSDGKQPSQAAQAILDAAGVTFDQQSFSQTPHYDDPNASGSDTAAITPTGVVAGIQVDRSPPPSGPIGGEDPAALATGRLLAARAVIDRRRRTVDLRVAVDSPQETIAVGLVRRKAHGKAQPLGAVSVEGGIAKTTLTLARKLRAGRYRAVLQSSAGWTSTLSLAVAGSKHKHKHKHH
jgi:hypothetical protein